MLELRDVSLRRGPRLLFSNANLTLHSGQRVGVTGANGTGKSSLFALLRGELHADTGDFRLPPNWIIAQVAQETPALDVPALDYVLRGDAELERLQAELRAAETAHDGHRLAQLHAQLDAIDGYSAPSRAARLMHGLGFTADQEGLPVAQFSGGWRMRLNLAQALMCRSDLLLLDEPTNHLDLDAVLWLEEWLQRYPGMLLLISHDREFLDRTVQNILHIEREQVKLYPGNYSEFETRRAEQLAQQQSAFERQQREIAHIQHFIDRFKAKASKAKQAQSRMKALARMERIAAAHADSPFHFEFPAPAKLPHPLLQLEKISAGYADKTILSGVELSLAPGDRVGLLGPNGAGKSTLIKLLAGVIEPQCGKRLPAPDLDVGYFAQHQLEQLHAPSSPLLHLQRLAPRASEQSLRDFLGGFGFAGERAESPVAPFSGGEKARLVLALLVYQAPNLLLLDEPTNHLDLEMRLALELALQDYPGAVVLVSHDRHLLRTVTDSFLLVAAGRAQPFDGDLDDYRRWLEQREHETETDDSTDDKAHSATARRDRKHQEAEQRQRLQPLRNELRKLDTQLEKLHTRQAELDAALGDSALYEAAQKGLLQKLLLEKAELDKQLASTEEQWLEVSEEIEQATADY
ncbi:MAG: ATP-binding cassette domain-containing protein [Gammaproteobacteria bacterium]|nr:ATP-binding cassette domain-containing protein [Gammaproteobacteria bacterium]